MRIESRDDLARVYTPGFAHVAAAIHRDPALVWRYTIRQHTVAIVTDGSAVSGIGNVGPLAALPVMEGKSLIFRRFADLDAVPICLDATDPDDIVDTVRRIAPTFGAIMLEDISAPRSSRSKRACRTRSTFRSCTMTSTPRRFPPAPRCSMP